MRSLPCTQIVYKGLVHRIYGRYQTHPFNAWAVREIPAMEDHSFHDVCVPWESRAPTVRVQGQGHERPHGLLVTSSSPFPFFLSFLFFVSYVWAGSLSVLSFDPPPPSRVGVTPCSSPCLTGTCTRSMLGLSFVTLAFPCRPCRRYARSIPVYRMDRTLLCTNVDPAL